MRASSERPDPMRPDTPSTSPGLSSNDTSLTISRLRDASHGQSHAVRRRDRFPLGKEPIDRPTDHQRHETFDCEISPRAISDHPPVAQYDDGVGKLKDVAEDVTDIDNRDALGA